MEDRGRPGSGAADSAAASLPPRALQDMPSPRRVIAQQQQELRRAASMYAQLDAHNDELEAELVRLRRVLHSFGNHVALRLRAEITVLRAEHAALREAATGMAQHCAADVQHALQLVVAAASTTNQGTRRSGWGSADGCRARARGDAAAVADAGGDEEEPENAEESWSDAEETTPAHEASALGTQLAKERVLGAMRHREAQRLHARVAALEQERGELQALLATRDDDHARHLRQMRAAHREAERTLTERVNMLTAALGRSCADTTSAESGRRAPVCTPRPAEASPFRRAAEDAEAAMATWAEGALVEREVRRRSRRGPGKEATAQRARSASAAGRDPSPSRRLARNTSAEPHRQQQQQRYALTAKMRAVALSAKRPAHTQVFRDTGF